MEQYQLSPLKNQGYTEEEKLIACELVKNSYQTLLSLARDRRRRSRFHDTMMTDDILHEAYLKLSGKTVWQSQEQYIRTASLAIRQVIVDHARHKIAQKRGGSQANEEYQEGDGVLPEYNETPEQILILNDLLERLEQKQPRLSMVVNARYFAAMSDTETASALGLSERTVRRDWQLAKTWLANKMTEASNITKVS
jgi:RNA polymerase sigma factor (TIGR02999 family)